MRMNSKYLDTNQMIMEKTKHLVVLALLLLVPVFPVAAYSGNHGNQRQMYDESGSLPQSFTMTGISVPAGAPGCDGVLTVGQGQIVETVCLIGNIQSVMLPNGYIYHGKEQLTMHLTPTHNPAEFNVEGTDRGVIVISNEASSNSITASINGEFRGTITYSTNLMPSSYQFSLNGRLSIIGAAGVFSGISGHGEFHGTSTMFSASPYNEQDVVHGHLSVSMPSYPNTHEDRQINSQQSEYPSIAPAQQEEQEN
jgi:hypothetical protein